MRAKASRKSTAECEHSPPEIDCYFGNAQGRGTHQSVEILDPVTAAADQEGGFLPKLCFSKSQAVQPHLFPLELADTAG
jgi:hypothetical protein